MTERAFVFVLFFFKLEMGVANAFSESNLNSFSLLLI